MEQRLEAVVVPVSDIDRTRHFYRALGFRLDLDQAADAGHRVVQLTPPGSSCSIVIGTGISSAEPGSTVAVLTVPDIEAAVADLQARGAVAGPITHCQDGFAHTSFRDPDGNLWLLVDGIHLSS